MESKILVLTEGEETEVTVLGSRMHGLFTLVDADYKVVPLKCSIYELYDQFMNDEYFDMVEFLKEKYKLELEDGVLTKSAFSAIYLIFDLDPHYQKYSPQKIKNLQEFFCDETENGKLYISYPMIEAFYDFSTLPDPLFNDKCVKVSDLSGKKYKKSVNLSTCIKKNKLTKKELSIITFQQYEKARTITGSKELLVDYIKVLDIQLEEIEVNDRVYVISTAPLMTLDYNYEKVMKTIRKWIDC